MTRIKLWTLVVSFSIIFSFVATVFGRGGVIVNRALEEEVALVREERARREAEVDMLRRDVESFSAKETTDEESVYIASVPTRPGRAGTEVYDDTVETSSNEGFKGIPLAISVLIAFVSSIVVTVGLSFIPYFRKMEKKEKEARKEEEKKRESSRGNRNYDDIDL